MKEPSDASLMQSLRKFNPGTFQSNEEVIRQFVVRNHEFNTVLEVLRENLETPSCQHVLIVSPRGRGKTMLLARLVAELRTNEKLVDCLWPVRFMEESQEIFTLADFWLEVLFQLAQECQAREPDLAQELHRTHEALVQRWREEKLEDYALAAVLEASDRLGRRLVLMVENLQTLDQEVDEDFGWKLRKTLQTEPQIMLVATATSRFKGLDDAEQSFFELFRIVDLAPLSVPECQCLWEMASGNRKTAPGIRPLQILTGGSPRLLVIMAGFARHKSLNQLMEELVQLIDDHTEYFRNCLQGLAKTERRVFLAIIDLWQPSSTGEIAARARMDVRNVSALLGRLVDRGAVTVEGDGRKRQYAASERLYSIYYKLRRERDEAAVVRHLIHFMVAFYRESELTEMYGSLRMEAGISPSIREGISRAMMDDQKIRQMFRDLVPPEIERKNILSELEYALALYSKGLEHWQGDKHQEAIRCFDEVLERLASLNARRQRRYMTRLNVVGLRQTMALTICTKGRALHDLGEFQESLATCELIVERFGSSQTRWLRFIVASSLYLTGKSCWELRESEAAIIACEDIVKHFGTSDSPDIQRVVALAMNSKVAWKTNNGEYEEAVFACDDFLQHFSSSASSEIHKLLASALINKGNAKLKLGAYEEGLTVCDEIIDRFDNDDSQEFQQEISEAWANKAHFQLYLGRVKEAITICDKVVERFGSNTEPEVKLHVAMALHAKYKGLTQLSEKELAIAICEEAVDHFDTIESPEVQVLIANVLIDKAKLQVSTNRGEQAGRTCEELEQRLDRVTQLTPHLPNHESTLLKWQSQLVRAQASFANGKQEEALKVFSQAYAGFTPSNENMMQAILVEVPDLIISGATASDLIRVLDKDKDKAEALEPLILALHQLEGKTVRAPSEVLEVAADYRIQIEWKRGSGDLNSGRQ